MKKILSIGLLALSLTACTGISEKHKSSPHFVDGKFQNTYPKEGDRSFGKMFKALFTEEGADWPDWIENEFSPKLKDDNEKNVVVTFIGHATFLIEIEKHNILIDPIFSKTAGPASWLGAKRKRNPELQLDELPQIHTLLVSHNHYDHLDLPSLKAIQKNNPKVLLVVPLGDKNWLEKEGFKNVVELDWWESIQVSDAIEVFFTPAQHSSGRGLFDREESFWGINTLKLKFFMEEIQVTLIIFVK